MNSPEADRPGLAEQRPVQEVLQVQCKMLVQSCTEHRRKAEFPCAAEDIENEMLIYGILKKMKTKRLLVFL